MYKLMITILFVCFCASIAQAQDDYHKFEVYGGFSKVSNIDVLGDRSIFSQNGEVSFKGFNTAATYNFSKYIGAKIEFTDHFTSKTLQPAVIPGFTTSIQLPNIQSKQTFSSLQGGIQIKNNSKEKRFKPFGHALFGFTGKSLKFQNATPDTLKLFGSEKITSRGFSTTFGGGLDVRISPRIDVRVIQFNYNIYSNQARTFLARGETRTFSGAAQLGGGSGNVSVTSIRDIGLPGGRERNYSFSFGIVFH